MTNSKYLSELLMSPYDRLITGVIMQGGGYYNAHAHIDRADTLDDRYLRHINTTPLEASNRPLPVKQNLVGDLHRGCAYTEEDLRERMSQVLDRLIAWGTTRLDTCIDATSGIGENGLLAIRVANELREKYADSLVMRIAPNPIFGLKVGTMRWEIFEEAARNHAQYLSALPEKDAYDSETTRDGKQGFDRHIWMMLELACEIGKEIHFHVDQANDPSEHGTETVLDGLHWFLQNHKFPERKEPWVWMIHMLSPSAYDEKRFSDLVERLVQYNVGVVVCPSAVLSNRQLRPIMAPTHNSITRILELCHRRVPMRIGTDNICDVFVPQSDGNMLTELKLAGLGVRFSITHVWAKLAMNVPLNEVDRDAIGRTLYEDRKAWAKCDPAWPI
ncbi:MAG: hypothetical protein Q7S57_02955 [bacterium]|nr:hypothetical protein [bacterium]